MIPNLTIRIANAMRALPNTNEVSTASLKEWVALFAYPISVDPQINPLRFSASATGDKCSITASNDRAVLAKQLAQLAAVNKYPEVETKLLQLAFQKLPKAQLSAQLELQGELRDVRWAAEGLLPLATGLELIPAGPMKDALKKWAQELEIEVCLSVGRSVGGAYTSFKTALPGSKTKYELESYIEFAEMIETERLPDAILDAIQAENPDDLSMVAHFTKTGVAKLGLLVENPSAELQRLAILALGTEQSFDYLGGFEGSMGFDEAAAVEFVVTANGYEAFLHYNFTAGLNR